MITACALGMCSCAIAANASPASSDDAPATKPAATATTRKHPKTAAKPSAAPIGAKSKVHTASAGKRSSRKKRVRGQQKIDSARAHSIQEALIREHYLSGEATGTWNLASEEAMRRYQADHGWQSKTVPDSRALIKLGLGPSKDHLLNPESAMTTVPDAPRAESMPTNSQSASPSTSTSHSAPSATEPAPAASSNQSDSSSPQ